MNELSDFVERQTRFEELKENKPEHGDTLRAKDGDDVPVYVDYREDRHGGPDPFRMMFCNAVIDDEATGWYLSTGEIGLKCMLMTNSQNFLIDANDGDTSGIKVWALRVVRQSDNQRSLVCELAE